MKKIILSSAILFLFVNVSVSQSTATYDILFTNFWNSTDHNSGSSLPSNAHWSPLVITNHNNSVVFFEMNGTASAGVELIAELGNVSTFQDNDYQNAFDANNAEQFVNAGDLFLSSGSTIAYNGLQVSEEFPLVSLLSMIAPSPDWFIGVNSLNLRDGSGWRNSISLDLFPYDAGTEEGTAYSIANSATVPQGTIQSIQGVAPFNSTKVATITFTLQNVLGVDEENLETLSFFPNPANDNITISNPRQIEIKSVEVYSAIGKLSKVLRPNNNLANLQFDVSNLNSGIYFLRLTAADNSSVSKKIIIN